MTVVDKTKADGEYEGLEYTMTSDYYADELNELFEVNEVNNFGGVRTVEIRVKNQEKLDYENLKFGAVNLYVENKSGDYATAQFDIIINNLNEEFTLSDQTFTLDERIWVSGECVLVTGLVLDPGVKIIDPNNRNYKDFRRILEERSTIISTNLTLEELSGRYTERVVSRMVQHYTFYYLYGKNIRYQKRTAHFKNKD